MFLHFHRHFWHILSEMKSVILFQIALIVLGAFIISLTEARPFGEALYFAFITGLTVGYGDIVATTAIGQVISVLLGLIGLLFTGLVVAIAVRALEQAWADTHGSGS
jgi:voltage-gated potassium channel